MKRTSNAIAQPDLLPAAPTDAGSAARAEIEDDAAKAQHRCGATGSAVPRSPGSPPSSAVGRLTDGVTESVFASSASEDNRGRVRPHRWHLTTCRVPVEGQEPNMATIRMSFEE